MKTDIKAAIGATTVARRAALQQKRATGDPRNPFQARPGMEKEFLDADQGVRAFDLILNLLEKEVARERRKPLLRILDRAEKIFATFGLLLIGTLGVSAVCVVLKCPTPVIQATAVIGVGYALARSASRK